GARGLRRDQGRAARRRGLLRRHRARDRPRGGRAEALRRRRAQPARLPHLGGPRGGAPRTDPRAGTAVAEPGAPQGGGRGAREPRRRGVASQAPAADQGPPQARALTRLVRLEDYIQDIPDFPKPGIVFKDITPLFLDADALAYTVGRLGDWAREWEADYVVSAEARGFALGGAVAVASGAGFILARKPGKLPREVSSVEYELEYGVDALEIHSDAVRDGAR